MPARQLEDRSTVAYAWIARRIQLGTYRPGHRLVVDELRRHLGMGNSAIREALRALASEGWVEWSPNVGARVAGDESYDARASLQQRLAIVEGAAIALAAPRLDGADLDRLERSARRLARAIETHDVASAGASRTEFHRSLLEQCPNLALARAVMQHGTTLELACRVQDGGDRNDGLEHLELVDSIRRRANPLEIELLARRHRLAAAGHGSSSIR